MHNERLPVLFRLIKLWTYVYIGPWIKQDRACRTVRQEERVFIWKWSVSVGLNWSVRPPFCALNAECIWDRIFLPGFTGMVVCSLCLFCFISVLERGSHHSQPSSVSKLRSSEMLFWIYCELPVLFINSFLLLVASWCRFCLWGFPARFLCKLLGSFLTFHKSTRGAWEPMMHRTLQKFKSMGALAPTPFTKRLWEIHLWKPWVAGHTRCQDWVFLDDVQWM